MEPNVGTGMTLENLKQKIAADVLWGSDSCGPLTEGWIRMWHEDRNAASNTESVDTDAQLVREIPMVCSKCEDDH